MHQDLVSGAFKDHFSDASDDYARYRPTYPDALFDWLADVAPSGKLAWDCGTGSGQAAVALAARFDAVIATDASAAQIAAAERHPRVRYRTAPAEDSGLDSDSVGLVTVGQAFHWFDAEAFFSEAARVLEADGVLALWCYETCGVDAACDTVIEHLYTDLTGPFWPPERALIEAGYASVKLPGREFSAAEFEMAIDWSVADMLGYLRTWSASKRYAAEHGRDPVTEVEPQLRAAWGEGLRRVTWPLRLRVCRPNAVD